jgi:translation initiation factor 2 beta subunit (eIF-2beta)/eIF-5
MHSLKKSTISSNTLGVSGGDLPSSVVVEDEDAFKAMLDSKKKKKKKAVVDGGCGDDSVAIVHAAIDGNFGGNSVAVFEPEDGDPMDSYESMSAEIYAIKDGKVNNPLVLPFPVVSRIPKKSSWDNFHYFCEVINRQPDHVRRFFFFELATSGSITGSGSLHIKGKFDRQRIEKGCRKYIEAFVQCNQCRGLHTVLEKDHGSNLWMVKCTFCTSERSVPIPESG